MAERRYVHRDEVVDMTGLGRRSRRKAEPSRRDCLTKDEDNKMGLHYATKQGKDRKVETLGGMMTGQRTEAER